MQSWADTSFGQLRGAGDFPSRAAVLGIVAAALGLPRGDSRLVQLHDALRVHVAVARSGEVRRDFHTVETHPAKPPTLTTRDYHHDAHYVALIDGDSDALAHAAAALTRPVYGAFLGRRACPPAVPLLPVLTKGDPLQALVEAARAARRAVPGTGERRRPTRGPLRIYIDGHLAAPPDALGSASPSYGTRRDHLVGPRRAYVDRPFTRFDLLEDSARPPDWTPAQDFFDGAPGS